MSQKNKKKSRPTQQVSKELLRRRKMLFEDLEQRALMAVDLVYPNDLSTLPSADLRFQAFMNGSTPSARLVPAGGGAAVASVALDSSGIVNIRRDDGDVEEVSNIGDTIRVDLASFNAVQAYIDANGGVLTVDFNGGDENPLLAILLGQDQLIVEPTGSSSSLTQVGFGVSIITTADITINNVFADFDGDLLVRSNPNDVVTSDALDPLAVVEIMSGQVTINGGRLDASNMTIEAKASKDVTITPESAFDGALSFAEVGLDVSAIVNIGGAAILNSDGTMSILADTNLISNVGRQPSDDGNSSDDDQAQDAAIAVSIVGSATQVIIGGASQLNAGGNITIVSNNVVNSTSNADGRAGSSDAGGTVANTTMLGDTTLLVTGSTRVISGGSVSLQSISNRTATTNAYSTPRGTTDDNNPNTTTTGSSTLSNNGATTPSGNMQFAAAVSVGVVEGLTRAEINSAEIRANGGVLSHLASSQHTITTLADSSTNTSNSDTGIGVAAAIQTVQRDAEAIVRGTGTILRGTQIDIDAKVGDGGVGTVNLNAISGPTGTDSSGDVNIAGALAINVNMADARAFIEDTININPTATANGTSLNLRANATTTDNVRALPKEDANGKSTALGRRSP